MAADIHDIIIIGGGVGGSALAKAMAEAGAEVLVLERETQFRDRVRGEAIMPWGVVEAVELGIRDVIASSGGHELPWWNTYQGSRRPGHRDLVATTRAGAPALAIYHPVMQQALIEAAASAGATVSRGARVVGVNANGTPRVTVETGHGREAFRARLIVAADGRGSLAREWGGFQVRRDPEQTLVAGVLLDGVTASDDAAHVGLDTQGGRFVLIFPQSQGRARCYFCYPEASGLRMTGQQDLPRFVQESQKAGVAAEYYQQATAAGPLATFDAAAVWVEHPYKPGVALIGDAAASSDPTWGQGLSLAIKDARVLRDHLLSNDDWEEAGNAYADEHKQYYGVVHTAELWHSELLLETGEEADVRRARALPLWREDRSRNPDTFFSGPGETLDEKARRRFFGEE
ncbi:MAG: hypothetical protein BZY88_02180 [SAR202 cluster bacterium Io17-Chloro-G9]|nr:MAG: hypothetical protein BZY88_02180 [SAR202 cluster bacterium Io17-Chloro-G9]